MKIFYAVIIMLLPIMLATSAQGYDDKPSEKLCTAVVAGDLAEVNTALKQGASAGTFCEYGSGKAPLEVILLVGKNADVVRALVKAGADINAQGLFKTLLTDAVTVDTQQVVTPNDIEFVRFLISMGADVNQRLRMTGFTALHKAAGNDLRLVQILVEAGADVNAAAVGGVTPLAMAKDVGKMDIVKYLKAHGAR
jgi:hypothetical protein